VALRSGVGLEKGLEGARWLVREGVHALASVGVASGLRRDLGTGDLIVGSRVIEEENKEESKSWESSPACSKTAYEALLGEGIPAIEGPIVSVKSPVSTPKEKAELYRRSHALVSDMESSSIARTAAEADLPLLAMRVVIDPPQRKVEPDLSSCLDQHGRICLPVLWRNLCRRPSLFPDLLVMTRDLAIALHALRRAWGAMLSSKLLTF
jgi:purine-nucleoside phosphorylase